MNEMKKVLESSMKIRFHDCDPFSHLNNSRYIDYLMTARTDQLEEAYGFNMTELAREQGVGWVSAQTQISYLFPVFVGEVVSIETRLLYYSEKTLLMEGLMLSSDKKVIKAVMWATLVHFHLKTQKSHPHADSLLQFFQQAVNPLPVDTSFEERVKIIKREKSVHHVIS